MRLQNKLLAGQTPELHSITTRKGWNQTDGGKDSRAERDRMELAGRVNGGNSRGSAWRSARTDWLARVGLGGMPPFDGRSAMDLG